MRDSSGYSLLEMMLVLVMIAGAGYFLFVQIPYHVQEKNIEISSIRLLEDLRETQQAAISEGTWYRVKFYPQTREYKIFRQGEFVKSVKLESGIKYGHSSLELTLLPTGAPSVGLTVILRAGNLERRVIVAPVMGRIRLEIVR